MNRFRYDRLTYLEIRERADADWLAIVPTGCTEQQGPHLPVGFDTWFVEALMLAAAERAAQLYGVEALVLPAMPFGPTSEHRNYGAGYIHIPSDLHDALVRAILDSLAEQGFKRIIVWRGCGGHALEQMIERFNQEQAGQAHALLPSQPFYEIWCRYGNADVPCGHADSFATAIMMHHHPQQVRSDKIYNPHNEPPDWNDPNLDFARYSSSGVIGDPTYANAELGAKLWEAAVEAMVEMLREVALRELAKPSVSLQEVIAILDRAGGKPLSEMVLEQRRSKEW